MLTITLAASGDSYSTGPSEILEIEASRTIERDLSEIHEYFRKRVEELESDCKSETAWVFINAAVMLEYLCNLVVEPGQKTDFDRYTEFICGDWLPEDYKNFEYREEHAGVDGLTKTDLPLQMYCVLRSAMVHSFSMIPASTFWHEEKREKSRSPAKYARRGSIVITHKKSGNEHLSNYDKDAACFVAESFIEDIRTAVENIFDKANEDEALRKRIENVVNVRPPLELVHSQAVNA